MSMTVAPAAAVRTSILLLLFLVPFSLQAQSGFWGSRSIAHAFLIRGNQLFDIDGRGVTTYDVSNPSAIARLSVFAADSETLDGAFLDANTLGVLTHEGIALFTVSSNGSLALRSLFRMAGLQHLRADGKWIAAADAGSVTLFTLTADGLVQQRTYDFMSGVSAIELSGDALYVAQGSSGITVIDLTGAVPNSPLPAFANDLVASGTSLYIAGGVDGLIVADITDPLAPRITGRAGAGSVNLAHVAASGSRVFGSEAPNIVYAFDISDADAPRLVTRTNAPVRAIAADANHVFVSGATFDRFGIASETGVPVQVLDAKTLAKSGAFVDDVAGPVSGVATDGSLAYVIDHPYFRVIDISNSGAPKEIGSLLTDDNEDFVKVHGTQVILYGRGDVVLIDVSNPYAPREVSTFHSFGRPPSNGAFARDTILEGNPWSGFHVVDFADYNPPGQIGGIKGHYYEIAADGGNTAYVASEGAALATVDLSDPRNPHTTNVIMMGVKQAMIVRATVSHSDLLLARAPDGIHVFSLINPLAPAPIAVVTMPSATLFSADDDTVLIASGPDLSAFDISAPAHPQAIATTDLALSPMQIGMAGGKTVIADRYGLRIFGPNTAPPQPPPQPLHHRAVRP